MKAPVIMLIVLFFVAIFLVGSVTDPFVGEGLYYGEVQSAEGDQWLNTVVRFEPVEGGQYLFTMYNIIFENGAGDAKTESMTKINLQYNGSYYKHIFGPLYLRPTGLHFPVIEFISGDRAVFNWQPISAVNLDGEGQPIPDARFSTLSHRSNIVMTDEGMFFDDLPYTRVDSIPEKLSPYIELLDAGVAELAVEEEEEKK